MQFHPVVMENWLAFSILKFRKFGVVIHDVEGEVEVLR
jgi:hypothetical protein